DKALEAVESALKDTPKNADLLARRAELLHLRGRWDDAEKDAKAALDADAEHFAARWVLARLALDRGDFARAEADFKWFVKTYTERSNADKDIKAPAQLLLVGLAGTENARGKKALADQFQFILDDVYGDAVKQDKSFWPAENAAGWLLLEKYNRP